MAAIAFLPERPIKEGFALTYHVRDPQGPNRIYEAASRPALELSKTYDRVFMEAYLKKISETPAPDFYAKLYRNHACINIVGSPTIQKIDKRDLVDIVWK